MWLIWLYAVIYSQRKILWENPSFSWFKKYTFEKNPSKWKNDHFWKNLVAWTWQSEPRGRNLYPETSRKEADVKDLDSENWDAFVFINNLDVHNLHLERSVLLEKKRTWRTLMVRTWMPSSSLTTLMSTTSIQRQVSFLKRSGREGPRQWEHLCLH